MAFGNTLLAAEKAATQATGFSRYYSIIILVIFVAVLYFVMIRPQRKKDKEVKEMRNQVKVGDNIVTIGGIYGHVVKTKEETIVIAVGAERSKMEIARWAISTVNPASQQSGAAQSKAESKPEKEEASSGRTVKMLKKAPKKAEETAEEAAAEVSEALDNAADAAEDIAE